MEVNLPGVGLLPRPALWMAEGWWASPAPKYQHLEFVKVIVGFSREG